MKIWSVILVIVVSLCMSCGGGNTHVLMSPDGPIYKIYIQEDSSPKVLDAADHLAHLLSASTDVRISITGDTTYAPLIKIGQYYKSDLNLLNPHSVAYWMDGENLYISGGSDQSVANSIYAFLENEIGIEFLAPDAEIIPLHENGISLPVDLAYSYTPKIEIRTVHSELFYSNPAFAAKRRVTSESFPGYAPGARVHTFHRFLPAEDYYNTHPEYFALRNGRRITTQLCLTNPDVLEIVKTRVKELKELHPEASVISVSQDDNTQYCQCDECEAIHTKEESTAGTMITFVNQVAEEFPDIQISTLAYQYTRKAPKFIKPIANVLVTLCSIECDRSAPIKEKCEDFAQDLKEWSAITSNIRIWDYTTQFTNFLAPFPNLRTLQPNIDLFEESNAKWIFEQHSSNPSELFELRSYILSQLLWNPDQDYDDLLEEFVSGYYEEAGDNVGDYIASLHNAIEQDSNFFLFLYGDPAQGFETWLSRDKLEYYDSLFDSAEKLVESKSHIFDRVRAARLGVDFAILEYGRRDLSDPNPIGGLPLLERLKRFNFTTNEQGITAMNEIRLTVTDYVTSYLATIERSTKPNIASGKKVTLLTTPKKYAQEDPQALTDGALGGLNFYSNWLGFEGEHAEAVVDLGELRAVSSISTAFLQVTNHLVFFPKSVHVYGSEDGVKYKFLGVKKNPNPLSPTSKINDIDLVKIEIEEQELRYIKLVGESHVNVPEWHNGSGLPAWLFLDEIMIQ